MITNFKQDPEILNSISPKNYLESYFINNEKRKIHKWFHYLEIYEAHFSKFRDTPVNILEIGVDNGGSLQMWKDYFGKNCKIYGIDILEKCKEYEDDQINIIIGSQEDRNFWKTVKDTCPKFDIIIDDGGHTMNQQVVTYEEMFPFLNDNGIYLCEDVHTSYWPGEYGGSYKGNTFIEYSKNFIDYLHASYSSAIPKTYSGDNIHGIHYYDSMIVIEKRKKPQIFHTVTGKI